MYSGDISPAFSNIYPEILEDRLSEECFRDVVRRVNSELYKAHSPWGFANILEGLVGMLTLWLYEDVISTTAKRRIDALDRYIDKANAELNEEGLGVKIIPLRRTGYLNVSFLLERTGTLTRLTQPQLDIQIPDPQVREDDPRSEDGNGGREVSEEEQARIERHTEGMNSIERPPAVMVNGHIM
jgi:hypothetical protein